MKEFMKEGGHPRVPPASAAVISKIFDTVHTLEGPLGPILRKIFDEHAPGVLQVTPSPWTL